MLNRQSELSEGVQSIDTRSEKKSANLGDFDDY